MTLEGEITLTRTLLQHEIWTCGETFDRRAAFVHLLLLANNRPSLPILRGRVRAMKVGQVGHSMKGLAKQWGWSVGKVRRYLEWLADRGTIQFSVDGDETEISFVNYDLWNPQRNADGTLTERSQNADGTLTETEREQEREREEERKGNSEENDADGTPSVEIGTPPVERSVLQAQAEMIGCSPECFEWFWNLHEAAGWVTGPNRLPIRKPLPLLKNAMNKWQARQTSPDTSNAPSGPQKNGAKNSGAVSASVQTIQLQRDLDDLRGEMESVYNTEGPSSVAYRGLQREALEIERQLAALRGGVA